MRYIQILSVCNGDLGNCCKEPALVPLINATRRLMETLQIIVPIILLIMISVQLFKLLVNPDEKNGLKKITNKIIAAMIIFFLPIFINITMSFMKDTESFQVAACWNIAKGMEEYQLTTKAKYNSKYDGKKNKLLINTEGKSNSSNSSSAGNGSALGQSIVNYALSFVGNRYVYGGSWSGELPYTGTDCSGFVQGVFRHHGIALSRTTSTQWADTSKYTRVSTNDIKAGDLAMYGSHVAIFTGNGNQIVHASNPRSGITITNDYRNGSSNFLGVMRIKGVY